MITTSDTENTGREMEVVLVNYRSRHHIEELLATWPDEFRVAVVDNSANVDGIRDVICTRANGRYVDGGGQGFSRAANLGAMSSTAPYVVFVNPDSRPCAADLTALVRGVANDPTALSHSATMLTQSGETEMGVGGWEPTVPRLIVYSLALHKLFPERGFFARPARGKTVRVDWTTGACMAVHRDRFREVGGFDEMFYVYAEDMSLGRRARLAGWRQVLRSDVRVPHGAGRSGAPAKEMLRLRGASFANYMLSYHRPLRAHAVLTTMSAGYVARGLVAARKRPDALAPYLAFVKGVATRRAWVGGVEVAQARFEEVTKAIHPRAGLQGWASLRRIV